VEFLYEYGLFAAKVLTIVLAIGGLAVLVLVLISRSREHGGDHIELKKLNDGYNDTTDMLTELMTSKDEAKRLAKEHKAKKKAEAKQPVDENRKRVFVLDFDGDIKASAVSALREEITAVIGVARSQDEVFLRLHSAGGLVHAYGLASSQLARLRAHKLPLTVAVDKVAASGGYMMACVADRILAAPFAIVGSIGVVAQIPNFNRLLRKHDVDLELITAGEHKRTLTVFGENTDKARAKFKEEIEDTHELFKDFIALHRPSVELDKVATGEHWFGTRALDLKLVDEIKTSDDYLLENAKTADLYQLTYSTKQGLASKFSHFLQLAVERAMLGLWTKHQESHLP